MNIKTLITSMFGNGEANSCSKPKREVDPELKQRLSNVYQTVQLNDGLYYKVSYDAYKFRGLVEWVHSLSEFDFNRCDGLKLLVVKTVDFINFVSLHDDISNVIYSDLEGGLVSYYEYGYVNDPYWARFDTSVPLSKWIDNPNSMNREIKVTIRGIDRLMKKYAKYAIEKKAFNPPPVERYYNESFVNLSVNNIPKLIELQGSYVTLMKKLDKPNYMLESALEKFTKVDFKRVPAREVDIAIKALEGKIDSLMEDKDLDNEVSLQVIPMMLNYTNTMLEKDV